MSKKKSTKRAWFNFGALSDYQQGRTSLPTALWGLVTGTTEESTQKDFLRLLGLSALIPLVGRTLTTWYLYRNPALFLPTKSLEHVDTSLLIGAVHDLVREDKTQLHRIQKKAGYQIKSANILRSLVIIPNLVVRQPLSLVPLAITPLLSGQIGEKYLLRPLRKKFTQQMMEDAKHQYVDEMTNTLLLAQKIRHREITLRDLRSLSKTQRQALLKQLYLATGKVYHKELGLTEDEAQTSLKDADKVPIFVDFGLEPATAKIIQMVTGLSVKQAALPALVTAALVLPIVLHMLGAGIYMGTQRVVQSFPHIYASAMQESLSEIEKKLTAPKRTHLISPTPAYFKALQRKVQQQKGINTLTEFPEDIEQPLIDELPSTPTESKERESQSEAFPKPPLPVSAQGERKIEKESEELAKELGDLANAIRKLQKQRKV